MTATTDLSALTLGTSSFAAAIARGDDPAAVLAAVFEGATAPLLRVIDTSNEYSGGLSEQLIGDAIRAYGGVPEGVTIVTKLDRDPATGRFSGDRMRRSLEESRTRLGMDVISLLHLHDPESMSYAEAFAAGGAVEALVRMKAEGSAERIGISGGPARMLERYVETGLFDAVITHNRFTLVDRSADRLLDLAFAAGVTVFNAAPYGSAPLAKWPAPVTSYAYRPAAPAMIAAIDAMGRAAEEAGVPLPAAALQFSMRDPRVSSTVVGINSSAQLARTITLATQPIPDELWAQLESLRPRPEFWQDPPASTAWDDFPPDLRESFTT